MPLKASIFCFNLSINSCVSSISSSFVLMINSILRSSPILFWRILKASVALLTSTGISIPAELFALDIAEFILSDMLLSSFSTLASTLKSKNGFVLLDLLISFNISPISSRASKASFAPSTEPLKFSKYCFALSQPISILSKVREFRPWKPFSNSWNISPTPFNLFLKSSDCFIDSLKLFLTELLIWAVACVIEFVALLKFIADNAEATVVPILPKLAPLNSGFIWTSILSPLKFCICFLILFICLSKSVPIFMLLKAFDIRLAESSISLATLLTLLLRASSCFDRLSLRLISTWTFLPSIILPPFKNIYKKERGRRI